MKKTTLLLAHRLARRACLWAALVAISALAFGPPARAAVTEAWVQRYSIAVRGTVDRVATLVRDAAGDIIVSGTSYGDGALLTIKYSGADGSVLWQKRNYDGSANRPYSYQAYAAAVDNIGNVVVTGSSNDGAPHIDYYTAKFAAADGALLWEHRYDGPGHGGDIASAVAVDSSGNVVVTGHSVRSVNSFGSENQDYYTAKYASADGALLWEQRYNGPTNSDDYASAVAVDASGNVVVTGRSASGLFDSFHNRSFDHYTAKYAAADGALLWEKRYTNGFGSAVTVDGSGNVVVIGYPAIVKYAAADGALLWEQSYVGPAANNNASASAVAVDGTGNVVVTGHSTLNWPNYDYYTAKYAAADGALLWEQRYNGPANNADIVSGLAVDVSGNVVVTGSSHNGSGSFPLPEGADYYTAKYAAADGALLWEQRYNGPVNNGDRALAVVVDDSGNAVVTGNSIGSGSSEDYYTAKYAAADGALLWEQRQDGFAKEGSGSAAAVVVDRSGNVVVTGYSNNDAQNHNYYTAKYAAADGALLWEQSSAGPENYEGEAHAVAVDGSGNVVVTGYSVGTNFNADYYTAKYAAADGTLLWEQRHNGLADSYDSASAVAVDGSGNVVVAGTSYGTNFYYNYYTAKYAAADGALLWEKHYTANGFARAVVVDGSGNVVVTGSSYTVQYAAADGALLWAQRSDGGGQALAVDGSGNVVVTGSSYVEPCDCFDYFYTVKYAAANGALLWEQRYTTGGRASAVAVDGSGNVVVTGSSFYTAKYAATDGALLWEKRYTNGGSASAVAVDGSGNVVVTGNSQFDYYTAKYAAADGALLWEKRYDGPANDYDYASSLALGPNGMVAVTGSSSGDFATVVYRDDVYPISIALVPAGVRLRFIGIPGRNYTIERAPAITGPWNPINTQTAPASGLIEYNEVPPPSGQSFYRTVQP